MKKNDLKYFIDVILFIDICCVSVIGLLLGFVIPTGKMHKSMKGFLGLHRHEWGDLHLFLSISLLFLLCLHIWLNWAWVKQMTKRYFREKWKRALWMISSAWVAVFLIGWIVSKM